MRAAREARPHLSPADPARSRRAASVNETAHELEHERLCSRLSTIPGVDLLPSHGAWVLMKVSSPESVATRLNRDLFEGAVTVPQHLAGSIRIPVRSARENEELLKAVARVMRTPDADPDSELDEYRSV
ncbi:hypothetical protein Pla163_15720 [Planctomycetes bacterium Pla163]|uniref:Uncharacterized protein n=1 Tax=Rohdeia mirabilis TaxID=2528008 RepID=A0A518CZ39_9BACT|nr:hypothetical protein Pla163_15720 [Planctomycetes bacterium Pla163]